jgi:hypothetical protein
MLAKALENPTHMVYVVGHRRGLAADIIFAQNLFQRWGQTGKITLVAKTKGAEDEATVSDVYRFIEYASVYMKTQLARGRLNVADSGSASLGTNLFQATDTFCGLVKEAREDRAVLVIRGEYNNFTFNLLDAGHYRIGLAQKRVTMQCSGLFWESSESGIPHPFILYVPAGIAPAEYFSGEFNYVRQNMLNFIQARRYLEGSIPISVDYAAIRRKMALRKRTFVEQVCPQLLLLQPERIHNVGDLAGLSGFDIFCVIAGENHRILQEIAQKKLGSQGIFFREVYTTRDNSRPARVNNDRLFAVTRKDAVLVNGIAFGVDGSLLSLEAGTAQTIAPGHLSA